RCACVAFAIALATAGMSTQLLLTMAALLLGGAAWVLALSTFNVTVQMSTPRWVVARALSLYQMATFGGMALGSWLGGVVTESHGVSATLLAAALVMLTCAALGLRLPLAKLADLNLDLLSRWQEPATTLAIEPRAGPVVITVEYIIHEDDVLAFLS